MCVVEPFAHKPRIERHTHHCTSAWGCTTGGRGSVYHGKRCEPESQLPCKTYRLTCLVCALALCLPNARVGRSLQLWQSMAREYGVKTAWWGSAHLVYDVLIPGSVFYPSALMVPLSYISSARLWITLNCDWHILDWSISRTLVIVKMQHIEEPLDFNLLHEFCLEVLCDDSVNIHFRIWHINSCITMHSLNYELSLSWSQRCLWHSCFLFIQMEVW